MPIGDVYQVKLSGNALSQTLLNIFYYEQVSGASGDASDLGTAFMNEIVMTVNNILSSDTTLTDMEIISLADGSDFYVDNFSLPGERGSVSSTSFVAWSFRLNPVNINFRAGGKRFGAVSTTDINDNSPTSGVLSGLNAVAVKLGEPITGGGNTFRPRIKHQLPIVDTNAPIEYSYVNVGSAEFARISTQRTRMPGRGN